MPVWPGDPSVNNKLVNSIDSGDEANVTFIQMSAHTATHIDAPKHFVNSGNSIENLDLYTLLGEVEVIEIESDKKHINVQSLRKLEKQIWPKRILFKTENSFQRHLDKDIFVEVFVALLPDAAEYLINQGVELIGIDYLSIAPFENGIDTHVALLRKGVIVIEGLNLADIEPGCYELIALPILLAGADGAPARVLLIQK